MSAIKKSRQAVGILKEAIFETIKENTNTQTKIKLRRFALQLYFARDDKHLLYSVRELRGDTAGSGA